MNLQKNNASNFFALSGFLGLAEDWNIFEFISHPMQIENTQLDFWEWAKQFNAQMSRENGKNFLLGYSLGGRLGMHAILQDPTLWAGAIFVSSHPGLNSEEERSARLKSDEKWAERFLHSSWEPLMTDWNAQPVFGHRSTLTTRLEKDFNRRYLSEQLENFSLGNQEPLLQRLEASPVPLLFIAGEYDSKFCEVAEKFKSFAKVSRILNAAHRVPWDNPIAFSTEVQQFIKELI